jgi:predicted dehydrogenase
MSASRREFLRSSAAAGTVAVAANLGLVGNAHAQGPDIIRVGLVGCGGRGTGAAEQCLRAGRGVRLVAMGDAFEDRLNSAHERLSGVEAIAQNVDVAANRKFVGLDAYQSVIDNCDLVILATPPGFRPRHLRAAVTARKHIFTEKPVAVDGPGIRLCLQLHEEARANNLSIVAGLQRRYQTGYLESMKQIHDGNIGTITSARCYWNQGSLWHRRREAGMTDLQWQIRNWLYFTWLSGDHICEQHVHNLDVVNWALGNGTENSKPVSAVGMGGRQVRTAAEFGHIFDHFAVDYLYPNNVHVMSMCRQIGGCENNISEAVHGTRGTWTSSNPTYTITAVDGQRAWNFARAGDNEPYQQEHVALIESIRNSRPISNLKSVAESTLTAIMGRMACYTGRVVTWNEALNSTVSLVPANLAFNMTLPVPAVAVPGAAVRGS